MVNKEELRKELDDWKEKRFMNQMNDHWSSDDYNFDKLCNNKILELEKLLREVE